MRASQKSQRGNAVNSENAPGVTSPIQYAAGSRVWRELGTNATFAMPQKGQKRILLIDHHDLRRETRERLLREAGYEVVTADRFDLVEGYVQEATFDLVVVSVADSAAGVEAVAYSQRLRAANAAVPILALSDNGL